ncbi:MAG TPA: transglutaminase family protein [Pirellulales bacterium]|jgi:transglutaminase-like putative cysteine protease|nr:transglutaminase family protein [Pirellulales bacterium]
MLIKTGFELVFDTPNPTAMVLLLHIHPERAGSLRQPDELTLEPDLERVEFLDAFGNRATRVLTRPGRNRFWSECLVEDTGLPDPVATEAVEVPVELLPPETHQFLLASRYCEADALADLAWRLFGNGPTGGARVHAVCDWVHNELTFDYQHARPTKTACDALSERKGVCRDFTHVAIALCRALNIPARYATGYLGDIGIPPAPFPMDFSAWFEAYVGHRWYTFDARHNVPRIGRIVMARGRDAADTALTTSFGPARLDGFRVWTDEVASPAHAGIL